MLNVSVLIAQQSHHRCMSACAHAHTLNVMRVCVVTCRSVTVNMHAYWSSCSAWQQLFYIACLSHCPLWYILHHASAWHSTWDDIFAMPAFTPSVTTYLISTCCAANSLPMPTLPHIPTEVHRPAASQCSSSDPDRSHLDVVLASKHPENSLFCTYIVVPCLPTMTLTQLFVYSNSNGLTCVLPCMIHTCDGCWVAIHHNMYWLIFGKATQFTLHCTYSNKSIPFCLNRCHAWMQ